MTAPRPELETDVLIAGGGPCGLTLAIELGLDLRVVRHADASVRALYQAPLALIRPDQIVAWRGADAQDAAQVLARAAATAGLS